MIAIFGAGKMGIKALLQIGPDKVSCFIDNHKNGVGVCDKPVLSLTEFRDDPSVNNDLVVITSKKYREEMESQLKENKIDNYIYFTPDVKSIHTGRHNNAIRLNQKMIIYEPQQLIEKEPKRSTLPGDPILVVYSTCG